MILLEYDVPLREVKTCAQQHFVQAHDIYGSFSLVRGLFHQFGVD